MKKRFPAFPLALAMVLALTAPAFAADCGTWSSAATVQTSIVSVGDDHSAVIDSNHALWCWGSNRYGQVGNGGASNDTYVEHHRVTQPDGTVTDNPRTYNIQTVPVKVLEDVVSVSCGSYFTAAIKEDGTLWMWGENDMGQLGDGTTINRFTPVRVLDQVAAVSCGYSYTSAIRYDGSLWMWGHNLYGQLGTNGVVNSSVASWGDNRLPVQTVPVKVMDQVSSVSCGPFHTAAIQTDGSLWMWGDNIAGQLGLPEDIKKQPTPVQMRDQVKAVSCGDESTIYMDATGTIAVWGSYLDPLPTWNDINAISWKEGWNSAYIRSDNSLWTRGNNYEAVETIREYKKRMDNVYAVACSSTHILAVQTDGSVWAWGFNSRGQVGNGGLGEHATEFGGTASEPLQRMPYKLNITAATPEATETIDEGYIYDVPDPGEEMTLPVDRLGKVTDPAGASSAVKALTDSMTAEQKQAPTCVDLATLYAENAVARAASKAVNGNEIVVSAATVADLEKTAAQAGQLVERALSNGGVTAVREVSSMVTLTTDTAGGLTVRVKPDILSTGVDKVRISTPTFALVLDVAELEEVLTGDFVFTAEDVGTGFAPAAARNKVTVDLRLPKTATVTVALPAASGKTTYQTVVNTEGAATASKYNPATTKIEGKVNTSGKYTVTTNEVDFSDISDKSAEMQKAIRYLASKGIVRGTGTGSSTFSPDSSISRAEIAALLVRALGWEDNSAVSTFTDVYRNNWFYSAAASSQKHGLITGFPNRAFRGTIAIDKQQIMTVAARVLVNKMGYKVPSNPSSYLARYKDDVVAWAQNEIALATKENLVVYRTDGTFKGTGYMTRGDAAIVIYRLFQKIW